METSITHIANLDLEKRITLIKTNPSLRAIARRRMNAVNSFDLCAALDAEQFVANIENILPISNSLKENFVEMLKDTVDLMATMYADSFDTDEELDEYIESVLAQDPFLVRDTYYNVYVDVGMNVYRINEFPTE